MAFRGIGCHDSGRVITADDVEHLVAFDLTQIQLGDEVSEAEIWP